MQRFWWHETLQSFFAMVVVGGHAAAQSPPGPPQSVAVSVQNSTVISWHSPLAGGAPTGYRVGAAAVQGGREIAVLTASASPLVVSTVPPGTYYVTVRAVNASGPSLPSEETAVLVPLGGRCPGLPNAPDAVAAEVTGSSVAFQWSPSSLGCAANSYVLLAGTRRGASEIARCAPLDDRSRAGTGLALAPCLELPRGGGADGVPHRCGKHACRSHPAGITSGSARGMHQPRASRRMRLPCT
jgi:hypothetical protein